MNRLNFRAVLQEQVLDLLHIPTNIYNPIDIP